MHRPPRAAGACGGHLPARYVTPFSSRDGLKIAYQTRKIRKQQVWSLFEKKRKHGGALRCGGGDAPPGWHQRFLT
eukprot:366245-Chlamydomonas_euryale.AAC.42